MGKKKTARCSSSNLNKKTKISNLIIWDKSGSNSSIELEAISDVNETIQTIHAIQKTYEEQLSINRLQDKQCTKDPK